MLSCPAMLSSLSYRYAPHGQRLRPGVPSRDSPLAPGSSVLLSPSPQDGHQVAKRSSDLEGGPDPMTHGQLYTVLTIHGAESRARSQVDNNPGSSFMQEP